MYWNRDILGTAGFSQPPATWDELYNFATKVTKRDDTNSILKSAIALGEYQNVTHAKDIVTLLILQAGGTITNYQGDELISTLGSRSSEAQQPSEAALRFFTEFANPSNTFYSWNRAQRESRAAFGANALALYLGRASEESLIRQANPNLNFAVAAVPQLKSKEFSLNVGTVYALAIPRTSDNPVGAQQAVYILASEQSSSLFAQAIGIPSARRDVLDDAATGLDDLFNKQAIITRSWTDPNPEKTDELFRAMIEGVTSGAAKIGEALQRGDQTLSTLLREQQL
jgi:ABC-type glycerol-3-phosphate transport system substrate-binding protein